MWKQVDKTQTGELRCHTTALVQTTLYQKSADFALQTKL